MAFEQTITIEVKKMTLSYRMWRKPILENSGILLHMNTTCLQNLQINWEPFPYFFPNLDLSLVSKKCSKPARQT